MAETPSNQNQKFWTESPSETSISKDMENYRKGNEAALERDLLKHGLSTRVRRGGPRDIVLDFATERDVETTQLSFLVDPYLPERCVVGFFGRGSTAKSSFLATMAAQISDFASTLWVSVEEPKDWIKVRHIKAGGVAASLAIATAVAQKKDQQGRTVGSDFNIYDDLEESIVKAKQQFEQIYFPPRPLRLVVLDTAVGLTTWGKGESPNDDAGVKRLLGFLQHLAGAHDVTIAIIGHSNKGKHDHFVDTVAGATAWTNSPRLSFVHARDLREENTCVMRVAKSNLTTRFAGSYRTEPVHTLHRREEGSDSVLCRVILGPRVWGEEESMKLFDDATRKQSEEDNSKPAFSKKAEIRASAVTALVSMVRSGGQVVTREAVHAEIGSEMDRRTWQEIDNMLAIVHGVVHFPGAHGQFFYRAKN